MALRRSARRAGRLRFTASAVAVDQLDDLNAFVVVLAENRDGSGRRLEVQRALVFDEADVATGMDTYCLCLESGATHYGGVTSWRIHGRALELSLDRRAASALGVGSPLRVALEGTVQSMVKLAGGLKRVLDADAPKLKPTAATKTRRKRLSRTQR